ncbi:hypothetical protein [Pseudobacter ginsenosidimutans]|uniref:Uncharacterized protein n=1 Tax=Pseudobacter ginsenosidimutans TaxID=661488 RepID=A0A4Q7N5H3_9BACT|nr:hypothetical protein [Pseudobacter ginsenosidimutans]QEC44792.1 hypothetical protein FSB84_25065 [Pseudobacter ginsenosidimutans]RZS76279.1 hypothetical protein EV199_2159 [Pseudobacter ginsenosidimutans]
MGVELEEIALFGFFKLNNRTILIQENDLVNIQTLTNDLSPIPIDSQKLQRLGFLRHPNGIYFRQQGSVEFLLRPLKNGQWEFCIDESKRIRILSYIHQLQRLWFALFDDHLFIPPQEKAAKEKKKSGQSGSRQKKAGIRR